VSALQAGVLGFAAFVIACGVIWRGVVKPTLEVLHDIVRVVGDVRDLIEPDDEGRSIPQRMSALETAMADFISKLGPMVEAIGTLAARSTPKKGTR
jgi:hypothetical protein